MTNTNNGVNLENPDMIMGLGLLVSVGLLTVDRYTEILKGRIL